MSDIFDEVDEILNDVDGDLDAPEAVHEDHSIEAAADAEKNFNESELQDIMAEIESLEKEFESESEEVVAIEEPIVAPVKKTDLQEEIDRELEMSLVEKEEEELLRDAPKTLSFEKKPSIQAAPTPAPSVAVSSSPEVSFEAHGQMNLNLGFKIGEEYAKLTIDPVKGLVVTMAGVELCLNQEDGCKVTMESGVKFSIPLTSSESNQKKKSA